MLPPLISEFDLKWKENLPVLSAFREEVKELFFLVRDHALADLKHREANGSWKETGRRDTQLENRLGATVAHMLT